MGNHGNGGGAVNHMAVGDDIAVLRQDKAGAGGGSGGGAIEAVGLDGGGDAHHAVNIGSVDLCRTESAAGADDAAGDGRALIPGILQLGFQSVHPLAEGSLQRFGFLLPAAVDHGGGNGAAADYQSQHKGRGQHPFPDGGHMLLLPGRSCVLGCVLVSVLPGGLVACIGGVGVGGFPAACARAAVGVVTGSGLLRAGRGVCLNRGFVAGGF